MSKKPRMKRIEMSPPRECPVELGDSFAVCVIDDAAQLVTLTLGDKTLVLARQDARRHRVVVPSSLLDELPRGELPWKIEAIVGGVSEIMSRGKLRLVEKIWPRAER